MKNTSVITILFLMLFSHSFAQTCIKEGEFTNSTDMKTSGDIEVIKDKKGRTVLKLNGNFKTEEGPDLDVYLSETATVSDSSALRVQALLILEGGQKYKLEEEVDVLKYKYVVIHCTKWNHWYGSAKLESCKLE